MMYKGKPIFIPIVIILVLIAVAAWYLVQENSVQNDLLKASGTIEVVEIAVSPEVSGRVIEVLASAGEQIEAGAPLLRVEDELLQAQRKRTQAAVEAALAAQKTAQEGLRVSQSGRDLAQAQLDAAQASLELANLQSQRSLIAARQAELLSRQNAWRASQPGEFDLPVWYFQKTEAIVAAQAEKDDAEALLKAERSNLETVIEKSGIAELAEAEKRLAEAQQSFLVAKEVLDRARLASDGSDMEDYAQRLYDTAEAELNSAQEEYNRLLSDQQSKDILEARARLAVAQEQYEIALDRLTRLQTGDQSVEVQIAEANIRQAEANLAQAQAGLERAKAAIAQAEANLSQAAAAVAQAQAELDLLGLQLERYTVYAPASGVVLVRNVEPGELIQAGATAMTLGQLDDLTLTVYLPEDRYGAVSLGDVVDVSVDSFPDKTFTARVTRIADKAEFTPRNVQTVEGRKTTFFAIELSVDNEGGLLKPGMPADVVFP